MRKVLGFMLVYIALLLGINPIAGASDFSSIYTFASMEVGVGPVSGITGLPSRTVTLGGSFQKMYDPTNSISGCTIGVLGKNECTYPGGGSLDFSFPQYSYPSGKKEVKVYVPKGSVNFYFVSHLPQSTVANVALKMGSPPSITSSPSINKESIFQRLVSGEEIVVRHDGSGTFNIVWGYVNGQNSQNKTEAGNWLYIRFLDIDTGDLYGTSGSILVDLPTYQAWYSAITTKWDSNGDPLDTNSGSTGSTGSTGGTTTPPASFSIKSSITAPPDTTILTQGVSSTITITPSSDFTLKSCSAASVSTSNYNKDSNNNSSMTLTPNSTNPVTITCISTTDLTATATLQVKAASNVSLTKISLSRSSLPNNDVTSEITIEPNLGASLPNCMVRELDGAVKSVYIEAPNAAGKFKLAAGIPGDVTRDLVVDCGGVTASFKIVLPLKVEVASVFNETTKLTTVTVQNFLSYLPSTVTSADLYVLVYVPKIPITQFGVPTEDKLYGYLVAQGQTKLKDSGWQMVSDLLLPILFNGPDEPYKTYQIDAVNGGKFTFSLGYGVTQKDADSANVEYYLAYLPAGSVVSFADGRTGKDWTKLQFIGDGKGGSFSVPPLIKFPVK